MISDESDWKKRALFLCKRGHLETELLLQHYVSELPLHLETKEKQQLFELLDQNDQTLFEWLLPTEQPLPSVCSHLHPLIKAIRGKYLMNHE
ncbi:succinate dehydrogenase assembly factor 2 [Thiomicrorhabdus sp.]|uniref:FAD assembly factor SdhE n=1 Tax=Thiomicrorhabdus sp. TaxID=2039724 RepID=UPI0029C617D9|nr:succinate dehydrogenase assembly factor 2 [Thiomicrorhabdus sp.]